MRKLLTIFLVLFTFHSYADPAAAAASNSGQATAANASAASAAGAPAATVVTSGNNTTVNIITPAPTGNGGFRIVTPGGVRVTLNSPAT